MRRFLLYFALKYDGDYKKILQAVSRKEHVENKDIENIESKIKCKYVTIIDREYPISLKQYKRRSSYVF